jgi:hypothetical protein
MSFYTMSDSPTGGNQTHAPPFVLDNRYKDEKHWERGSKSKHGAPSDKLIHLAVGHAITNWEHVETATAIIFSHFTDFHSIAAIRAYGTMMSTRARYAAVKEAMNVFFGLRRQASKRDRKVYEQIVLTQEVADLLLANYLRASSRRNDIAHGVSLELSYSEAKEQSWFLVPPSYNSARNEDWIEDDFKWRASTGRRLSDPEARFTVNKMHYKNADYVFGVKEIKVFAGKFAYLYAEILSLFSVFAPQRLAFSQKQLREVARRMSQ